MRIPLHPRPASLTRSLPPAARFAHPLLRPPLRRSLASLYALTPASRSRARRRVSHAASSTLFPANPLPGVSLASSRDNLARRARPSGPQLRASAAPGKKPKVQPARPLAPFETRTKQCAPRSLHAPRAPHAVVAILVQVGSLARRRRRPLPCARVAVSPRLPHLVRFERVVAFRVASTAHSRSSRSPTMCLSSAATPPLFEVCCHLVR